MSTLTPISLDWDNIQTVFLDMDGTLLDLHFDNYFWLEHMPKRYAKHHQLSQKEAKHNLTQLYEHYKGQLNWYCIDHWQEQLQMDIIALKHEVAHKIKLRGKVESFLRELNKRSCEVILLTNAHHKTIKLKFSYAKLAPYFDRIISAHDIRLAKEQEGFWQRLYEHHAFDKKYSLFIDDNLDVLQCAKQYNLAHLLSIAQPDSQQAASNNENFQAVECFSQLF
ncbi:MAG: GMP/IMP nucleotidase [Thiotrichaceae bacterium]|nr:GMP/IMP nucleotidase [Thiotrichaceae bacterium]